MSPLLTPVRVKLPKLVGTLRGMTFTSGELSTNGPIAAAGFNTPGQRRTIPRRLPECCWNWSTPRSKFTHGELICADTGTENVPDLPPTLTVPPVTNGVLKTAPDLVISVESVVREKVNAEFENDSAFVAPVGVTLPEPMPWKVNVILMLTAYQALELLNWGFPLCLPGLSHSITGCRPLIGPGFWRLGKKHDLCSPPRFN